RKSRRSYAARCWLFLCGSGFGSGVGVLFGEAFDAARGVHELLFAGEETMAIGTNFHPKHIALDGGARTESVSAGAVDGYGVIVGMNTGLHESPFCRGRSAPRAVLVALLGGVARSRGNHIIT